MPHPPSLMLDRHRGRVRLALVLVLLTLLAATGRFLENSLIKQVRKDCSSLFADRLVPATLLVRLTDELHTRYHTLHRSLSGGQDPNADLTYRLSESDAKFDELLEQFEQTYLVRDEAQHLQAFRSALDTYRLHEKSLLHANGPHATEDRQEYHQAFTHARSELRVLTDVQLDVGARLNEESLRDASSISTLTYLQGAIGFAFGLLAAALTLRLGSSSNRPRPTNPNLH